VARKAAYVVTGAEVGTCNAQSTDNPAIESRLCHVTARGSVLAKSMVPHATAALRTISSARYQSFSALSSGLPAAFHNNSAIS